MKTKNTSAKSSKSTSNGSETSTDRFGSRLSSRCHKINSVLSKKPLTREEIAKKSRAVPALVYNHLRTLLNKGYVREVNGAFAVKKSK